MRPRCLVGNPRGFGLIEIVVVLVVVSVAGVLLYKYMGSTAKTMEKFQEERPLGHTRLAADRATLAAMVGALRTYQAEHEGKWPPDKSAVAALMAGPPRFQCAGGDFDYDPASGAVSLTVTDPLRC
jgi:prepilin-type N-terminal cleavage/methylation domain-containing protein